MALYAFDGTWNERKDDDHVDRNTNVVRFFDAYHAGSGAGDLYIKGIGTRMRRLGKVAGGAFGLGQRHRLDQAYQHLCKQWADGDTTIDIVGFSRGAATTLDFCHMVMERGIRRPGTDEVVERKPSIRFVGVWDTVAAFGLGITGIADFNFGHRLHLPKRNVQYAFHALALDERRLSFMPTRLKGACEVWFRGVHSDVGGGNENRALNDVPLAWMMRKALAAGLPISRQLIGSLDPDATAAPKLRDFPTWDIRHVTAVDRLHHTVTRVDGCRATPDTCVTETTHDELVANEVGQNGIETLPEEFQDRFQTLAAVAERYGRGMEMDFDDISDPLLGLIEARMPLVTDDAGVAAARDSIYRLMGTTVRIAREKQSKRLNEFFLNLALHELMPIFPFTD
jgi:hypothetical protein